MARLNDIIDLGTDKDHKSIGERSWSAARLLWLPSILGIVAGQDKFIVGGVWKNLYDRLQDQIAALVDEAVTNPATSSLSGGKAISYFAEDLGNKLATAVVTPEDGAIKQATALANEFIDTSRTSSILSRGAAIAAQEQGAIEGLEEVINKLRNRDPRDVSVGLKKIETSAQVIGVHRKNIFIDSFIDTELTFKNRRGGIVQKLITFDMNSLVSRSNKAASVTPKTLWKFIAERTNESNPNRKEWARLFLDNWARNKQRYIRVFSDESTLSNERTVKEHTQLLERRRQISKDITAPDTRATVDYRGPSHTFNAQDISDILAKRKRTTVFNLELNTDLIYTLDKVRTGNLSHLTDFLEEKVYSFGNSTPENKTMAGLEMLHRKIFKAAGQESLYDVAYARKNLKSNIIARVTKTLGKLQTEIDSFKNEIQSLHEIYVRPGHPKYKVAKEKLEFYAQKHFKRTKSTTDKNIATFVEWVQDIKTEIHMRTDKVGLIPFQTLMIEINLSKGAGQGGKVKIPFNLEALGHYLPDPTGNLRSTFLSSGLLGGTSIQDIQTQTLAVADSFDRSWQKIWTDIIEADLSPEKATMQFRKNILRVTEAATLDGGTPQDFIRTTKIVPEMMQILSGETGGHITKSWYRGIAGGYNALKTLTKDFVAEVVFDMEFNYSGSRTGGVQHVAKDATTRSYWLSYQLKKEGKMSFHDILINQQEDTWNSIKNNVKAFMTKHGEDGLSFDELEEVLKKARKQFTENAANPIKLRTKTLGGISSDVLKQLPEHIYRDEAHAISSFAKNLYQGVGTGSTVLFAGHAVREADLPIVNAMANRALKQARQGGNNSSLSTKYLERLARETTMESLIAQGNYFDTFQAARLVTVGNEQSLKLTSIFESIIRERIDQSSTSAKGGFSTSEFFTALHSEVAVSNKAGVDRLIKDLPLSIQKSIREWYEKDKAGLLKVVKKGGHHAASFDTGVASLLKDLLSEEINDLKFLKPIQYENLVRLGKVAEEVEKGRSFAWHHKIDLLNEIDLYSTDPGLGGNHWLYSSLYSFTPSQAAKGVGAALGIEKYLPFAMFAQLQKQRYQVSAARALAPSSINSQIDNAGGRFPILRSRLWNTLTRDAIDTYSDFKSTAELGIEKYLGTFVGSKYNNNLDLHIPVFGSDSSPLPHKATALAWHLPTNNRILGEDTGVALNKTGLQMLHSLPKGGSYNVTIDWEALGYNITKYEVVSEKLTVVELLKRSGLDPDTVRLVKNIHGNATVAELMKKAGNVDDGSFILELLVEEDKLEFFENIEKAKKKAKFKGAFFDPDSSGSLLDTTRKDAYVKGLKHTEQVEIVSKLRNELKRRLKQTSLINSIRIIPGKTVEDSRIIFNFTPISTTSGIKVITEVAQHKGYIFGQTGATYIADNSGASFLLTDKSESMDQFINKHMRRALRHIWQTSSSSRDQKTKIIKMLSDGFNLTAAEVKLMFEVKAEVITNFSKQSSLMSAASTGIKPQRSFYTIRLKNASKIPLDKLNIFSSIHRMLESAGISQDTMKSNFIKMNQDRFKELGIIRDMKTDLGKLWDKGITSQKGQLNRFLASGEFDAKKDNAVVREIHDALARRKVALSDMYLHIDSSTLTDADIRDLGNGMFNKDDTLHKSLRFDSMASLYLTDMAVMETTGDFRWMNGLLRDSYGTPTKKSFSGWQMMLLNRQFSSKDTMNKVVKASLMATSGSYDPNIKQGLRVYQKSIMALQQGFGFGKAHKNLNTLSIDKIQKLHKAIISLKSVEGETLADLLQRLKEDGSLTREAREDLATYYEEFLGDRVLKDITKQDLESKLGDLYGKKAHLTAREALDIGYKDAGKLWAIGGATNGIEKELLFLDLPQLEEMLKNTKNLKDVLGEESTAKLFKQVRSIENDFSEQFFKGVEDAIQNQASPHERARFKQRLKDGQSRLLRGKIYDRLPIANLYQEGPMTLGTFDKLFFFGQSKHKLDLVSTIAEQNINFQKVQVKYHGILQKLKAGNITKKAADIEIQGITEAALSQQKQFATNLAETWSDYTFMGLSNFEWRARQFYAEGGAPYQKAADILPIVKATVGKLTGFSTIKSQPTIGRAIKEFITGYKANVTGNALTNSTATINTLIQDMVTPLITADSLKGLTLDTKLYNEQHSFIKVLKHLFKERLGKDTDGAKVINKIITGIKEVTFGENLQNLMIDITKESKNRTPFLATKGMGLGETLMTAPNFEQWVKSMLQSDEGLAKIAGNEDAIVAMIKGKSVPNKFLEMMKREPGFANPVQGNISEVFVASAQLFELAGVDRHVQRSVTFINSLEQLLQRGDYDGDLVQKYLLSFKDGKDSVITRKEAVEALRRSRLKTATRAILMADMEGTDDYIRTWADNLRLLTDKFGDDYEGAIRALEEKMSKPGNTGRLLLESGAVSDNYLSHQEKTLKAMIGMADASSSLEGHATFMVQKLLTPFVGEQIHTLDKYYYGGDISGVKNVLDSFDDIIKRGDTKEIRSIMNVLGLDIEYMKTSQGYVGKTEFEIFNEWSKRKRESINFLAEEVSSNTGWLTKQSKKILKEGTNLTHMDIFDVTYRAIAQFPITKDKVSDIASFKKNYRAFINWSIGADLGSAEADLIVRELVHGMSAEARPANLAGKEGSQYYNARLEEITRTYKHAANIQDMMSRASNTFEDASKAFQSRNALGSAELLLRKLSKNPEFYAHMYDTLGVENLIGVSSPEELASRFLNITPEEALWKRSAIEQIKTNKSKMSKWLLKGKWSKRLAIGALASIILDPNTNSILLPDQRGHGEANDWPSIHEITRSYKNRAGVKSIPKLREKNLLPGTVDKLIQEANFPKHYGSKHIISEFIPTAPRRLNYNRDESYKNNELSLQEYSRKLNGILIR